MRLGDENVYIAKSRKFKTQNQVLSSTAIYILFEMDDLEIQWALL